MRSGFGSTRDKIAAVSVPRSSRRSRRRQHHLEAGEPRVEILAELAVGAARSDVLMGSRDHPDVDLDGLARTDRADFTLLEDAEQGDLRFRWKLGDLQRAAAGVAPTVAHRSRVPLWPGESLLIAGK